MMNDKIEISVTEAAMIYMALTAFMALDKAGFTPAQAQTMNDYVRTTCRQLMERVGAIVNDAAENKHN